MFMTMYVHDNVLGFANYSLRVAGRLSDLYFKSPTYSSYVYDTPTQAKMLK
jgi:hypothetical protein